MAEHSAKGKTSLKTRRELGNVKTVLELLDRKDFNGTIREALRKRSRKGKVSDPLLNLWWTYFVKSMADFSEARGFRSLREGIETALRDEKLRGELVAKLVETDSQFAVSARWQAMTDDLINQMKAAGMERPVIIDYGAGEGQSTEYLERRLKANGIMPDIIATDKQIPNQAKERLSGTRSALAEHDLRRRSFFGRHGIRGQKRADVVRLGLVLQYMLRENASAAIRNAMADVRDGGLIVVGGLGFRKEGEEDTQNKYAIYRKIDRDHVVKISSN
ncbi:MAG: hypothetical protein NT067_06715 [Candidatus Diapherotrites archaeon]|nr:hypothetical protein [Candidatus Diapherotrites archaeon]